MADSSLKAVLLFVLSLCVVLWGVIHLSSSNHMDPVIVERGEPGTELVFDIHYLIATDRQVTFQDIIAPSSDQQWRRVDKQPLFLGSVDGAVWVRLVIPNRAPSSVSRVMMISWPFFDLIEAHVAKPQIDGRVESFHSENWRLLSPLQGHLPCAFALPATSSEEQTVYLHLSSDSKILLPLQVVSEDLFQQEVLVRLLLLGLFFGTLLAMCCYNTSLFIFTGDDSYAYYVIYVLSIVLYTLVMTGVGQAYVWPGNGWISSRGYGVFSSFSFLTAALFIRRFLSLTSYGGWLLHLSNIIIVYWLMMLGLYLVVTDQRWLIISEDYGAVLTCIAGLVTTVTLWYKGDISAKYITIAWTLLILSTLLLMLGLTGVVPYSPLVQNSQNVGFVVEVILLSLALAERINRERLEKEQAQALSLTLHKEASAAKEGELTAQRHALAVERQAKEELERRVDKRTIELQRALQALESVNRDLGVLSLTDELTNLANRRHFNEVFIREFKRALRSKQPLSLIMVDIDNFKLLNDTYGHQVGDDCLIFIADILATQAGRAEDFVARYGGEEFVVILPGELPEVAAITAERMRSGIQTTPFYFDGGQLRTTASFGVAGCQPHRSDQPMELLNRADSALYRAKKSGKNCVEVLPLNEGNTVPED